MSGPYCNSCNWWQKLAQHHLEALVGDADSLLWPDGWRFDWKRQKDRQVVDWESAFNELVATYEMMAKECRPLTKNELNTLIKDFTTIKPGPRVPRLWAPKEKNK